MGTKQIAIVFTRHELAGEQDPARNDDYAALYSMNAAAAAFIEDNGAAAKIIEQFLAYASDAYAETVDIYGVIPPILRSEMYLADLATSSAHCRGYAGRLRRPAAGRYIDLYTFEAHNLRRAGEGEVPQFEFHGWRINGHYLLICPPSGRPR